MGAESAGLSGVGVNEKSDVDGVGFDVFPELKPNVNVGGFATVDDVVVVDGAVLEAASPKENVGGLGAADGSVDGDCPNLKLNPLFGAEVDGLVVPRLDKTGCVVTSVFDGASEETVDGEEDSREDKCLA